MGRTQADVTELVAGAAEGDQAAWRELHRRYGRLVTSVARSFRLGEADVADVAMAFRSYDMTLVPTALGPIRTNVATICAWTWMCTKNDIHANDAGYAVMGDAVAARLG